MGNEVPEQSPRQRWGICLDKHRNFILTGRPGHQQIMREHYGDHHRANPGRNAVVNGISVDWIKALTRPAGPVGPALQE